MTFKKKRNGLMLLAVTLVMLSCDKGDAPEDADGDGTPSLELMGQRPNVHLTPPEGWMNDPNGMVYFEGNYHLFYQHNPNDIVWGPMHWRHAVSQDLLNWEDKGVKLEPDGLGAIFSGSAVVDWNNTSGFQTGEKPPLVAIFTHAGNEQVQSLAYSNDGGETWVKYDGNPVLEHHGDFRDPKVFYHDNTNAWIMVVAAGDRIKLYSSTDLKDWNFESDLGPNVGYGNGVWECPDLFPVKADDGTEKWVMLVSVGGDTQYSTVNGGGGTQYFMGSFDGKNFYPDDDEVRWIDYGIDNYAGVTWSDIPQSDGRRIFVGWMNNWPYAGLIPATDWRGTMTLPREVGLAKSNQGKYYLTFQPIEELERAVINEEKFTKAMMEFGIEDNAILASGSFRIKASIDVGDNSAFELKLHNSKEEVRLLYDKSKGEFVLDRSRSGRTNFHDFFSNPIICEYTASETVVLDIVMDKSSIELFINQGERVMTALCFPRYQFTDMSIMSTTGTIQINELVLSSLKKTIIEN